MIEPFHPLKGSELDGFTRSPRSSPMNHFGLVKSIDTLRQSVVTGIADAANRRLDAGFRQPFGVLDRDILAATIRVMHEPSPPRRPALMQCLLQSIEHEPRLRRSAISPAQDVIRHGEAGEQVGCKGRFAHAPARKWRMEVEDHSLDEAPGGGLGFDPCSRLFRSAGRRQSSAGYEILYTAMIAAGEHLGVSHERIVLGCYEANCRPYRIPRPVRWLANDRWRGRYLQLGLKGLEKDAPRPGRTPAIDREMVAEVIRMTIEEKPAQATHWSTRSLAAVLPAFTAARIVAVKSRRIFAVPRLRRAPWG